MLTQDQIDNWEPAPPTLRQPFVVYPPGTDAKFRFLDSFPSDMRVVLVVPSRAAGPFMQDRGFEWVQFSGRTVKVPQRAIITQHAFATKAVPLGKGDALVALGATMLGTHKSRTARTFRHAAKAARYCLANTLPRPWSMLPTLRNLGINTRVMRRIDSFARDRVQGARPWWWCSSPPHREDAERLTNEFCTYVNWSFK